MCVCVYACSQSSTTSRESCPACWFYYQKKSPNWPIFLMIPLIRSVQQSLSPPVKSPAPRAAVGLTRSAWNAGRPLPPPVSFCVAACQSPSHFLLPSCMWLAHTNTPHHPDLASFESLINVPEGHPQPRTLTLCKRRLLTFLWHLQNWGDLAAKHAKSLKSLNPNRDFRFFMPRMTPDVVFEITKDRKNPLSLTSCRHTVSYSAAHK